MSLLQKKTREDKSAHRSQGGSFHHSVRVANTHGQLGRPVLRKCVPTLTALIPFLLRLCLRCLLLLAQCAAQDTGVVMRCDRLICSAGECSASRSVHLCSLGSSPAGCPADSKHTSDLHIVDRCKAVLAGGSRLTR